MLVAIIAAVTLTACQGALNNANSNDGLFANYFRASKDVNERSMQDHAHFAFRGGSSSRPMPEEVTMLDVEVYPKGYVYVDYYNAKSCNGDVVAVAGRPTGVCLRAYEDFNSSAVTGSYIYTCNSGTSYTQQFSDPDCQSSLPMLQEAMYCENSVGKYGSMRGFCNSDPSLIPVPSNTFLNKIQYDSPSTCDAEVEQFESFLTNNCFSETSSSSMQFFSDSTSATYNTSDCTGTASETKTLSQTCTPITTYPVVSYDNVAYKWEYGVVDTGATFADGYVWVDLYQSKDCVGTVSAQQGHPTNKCLLLYSNATSSDATGSYMYTCNNAVENYFEYSDLECTVSAYNNTKSMGCQNILGRFGSGMGRCNADSSALPIALGDMVVQTLYNAPGECTSISAFESFMDDTCFHNGNNGFAYQWPNVTFYEGDSSCGTTPTQVESLPQTCQAVAQYPADTHVATQWSLSEIPFIPTMAPSAPPTSLPTEAAYDKGFLYVNLYESSGCSGPIVAVTGRPTETCLVAYEDSNSDAATGSYMFTCYGDQSMTEAFSDTECKVPVSSTTNDLGCRNTVGRFRSAEGKCTSDDSRLPLPASNFTTEIIYDSRSTCDANIVQFESFESDHCFNNGGNTALKYEYPTVLYYTAPTCSAAPASNASLSTTCTTVTVPTTTNNLAYKWTYGDVNFGGGGSKTLTDAEIGGIAAGGAVALIGASAAAYYFMSQGVATGASTAATATATGGSTGNPMVSAV